MPASRVLAEEIPERGTESEVPDGTQRTLQPRNSSVSSAQDSPTGIGVTPRFVGYHLMYVMPRMLCVTISVPFCCEAVFTKIVPPPLEWP